MRHFTVDEANALLPMLNAVLQDLQGIQERLREAVEAVRQFEMTAIQNGHGEHAAVFRPEHNLETIQEEMQQRLRYLQGVGVQLKDIQNGVIDFPSRREGRDVYLCWHLGEERVAYWHEISAGFQGRQPL